MSCGKCKHDTTAHQKYHGKWCKATFNGSIPANHGDICCRFVEKDEKIVTHGEYMDCAFYAVEIE